MLNGGALVSGDDETVFNDMLAVVDMAHSALAVAGVIVRGRGDVSEDLVRRACRLAERAGADYVVTAAAQSTARRTVRAPRLLRDSVGPRIQVKAAGRFRSLASSSRPLPLGRPAISAAFSPELAARVRGLQRQPPPERTDPAREPSPRGQLTDREEASD